MYKTHNSADLKTAVLQLEILEAFYQIKWDYSRTMYPVYSSAVNPNKYNIQRVKTRAQF